MNRGIAERIIKHLVELGNQTNSLTDLSKEIADHNEAKIFRKILAQVMIGGIDLLELVVKQYPDLDPHTELFEQECKKQEDKKAQNDS